MAAASHPNLSALGTEPTEPSRAHARIACGSDSRREIPIIQKKAQAGDEPPRRLLFHEGPH